MIEPVRPNTVVTGTDTVAGVSHTGTPPDIERISPLAPLVRPIVFPIRVSQLLNVRILSLRATTPESVERFPESVDTFVFVVLRLPERVVMVAVFVVMFPVAVARLDSVVEIRPERVATVPLIAFCALRLVK